MRINDGRTFPGLNIFNHHITEEGGFTGTRLTNGIEMSPTVFVAYIDGLRLPAENALTKKRTLLWKILRWRGFLGFEPLHAWRFGGRDRQMIEARDLFA